MQILLNSFICYIHYLNLKKKKKNKIYLLLVINKFYPNFFFLNSYE